MQMVEKQICFIRIDLMKLGMKKTVLLTFIKKYTIIFNSIFNLWGNYYAKTVMGRSQGY